MSAFWPAAVVGVGREGGGVGGGAGEDAAGCRAPGAIGAGRVVQSIAEALIGSGQPVQARRGPVTESAIAGREFAPRGRRSAPARRGRHHSPRSTRSLPRARRNLRTSAGHRTASVHGRAPRRPAAQQHRSTLNQYRGTQHVVWAQIFVRPSHIAVAREIDGSAARIGLVIGLGLHPAGLTHAQRGSNFQR